jgi:hypothetical protein
MLALPVGRFVLRGLFVAAVLIAVSCNDDAAQPSMSPEPDGDGAVDEDAGDIDASLSPCADRMDTAEYFELGLESVGTSGLITAKLVAADPAPPERYLNDWTIEFLDEEGELVTDAEITMARPFMPKHGHDGTFAPTVTELEPGRFEITRLNLWMRGGWLIQVQVSSPEIGSDYIEFSTCIDE